MKIPECEWEELSRKFEEWFYQKMSREEIRLDMWYGPSRESSGEFLAYCAGYLAGKEKYGGTK
jgi:hypothetical protein